MTKPLRHFRDPCVHCGMAHDDVAPGPCLGDPGKAVPMAYCINQQAWQRQSAYDEVLIAMSNGEVWTRGEFPASFRFGWLKDARTMNRADFYHSFMRGHP